MKTILVVDDEPQIAEIVTDYLKRDGFDVIVAGDGMRAIDAFRSRRPDLVILDLRLPRMDGIDVARAIRRESDAPIIMLTARVEEEDRLEGLDVGADDYVTKPFSPRELVARVRAVLRRTSHDADVFQAGAFEIDVARRRVTRGGELVELTPGEFRIVATLARHPGRVFTRAQLVESESFDRAVDSHIKNIRRKLGEAQIESVYGIGYRWTE